MSKVVLKNGLNFFMIVVCLVALIILYYFMTSHLLIKETFAISEADNPSQEQLIEDTKARTAWKYKFTGAGSALIYPIINASDKYVYAGINKTLFAIDKKNGDKIWEYPVPDIIIGKPVIAGDVTYFTAGNKLYAVDGSGESKWTYQTATNIEPSLMMYNGILYFGSANNKLHAVSQSGHLIWSIDVNGKISAPPVASQDKLYLGDSSKHIYAVDANNGHVIWKVSVRGEVQNTPIVYKDTLFFVSVVLPTEFTERESYIYAVNTQNGNLKWRNNNKMLLTAPTFYNELVYVGDSDGKLYTYEHRWGQKKWEFQKDDWQMVTPIMVNTTVFFQSNDSHVFVVDIDSGKLLWEAAVDGIIKTPPLIDEDYTYFYTGGYLCALKNKV